MEYKTRSGEIIHGNDGQDRFLSMLYGSVVGRAVVKVLVHPVISKIGGAFLNSPLSKCMINSFIKKNDIDMNQYEDETYHSYNDFFIRTIKPQYRPIDEDPTHLISPCDAKLMVYPITKDGRFVIKQTPYDMDSLLQNPKLAKRYEGGLALVFRLTVDDYHHYFYVDDGKTSREVKIPGVLHTVNPVANDVYPIYKENSREYCLLKSDHFKTILMMEVGALMVGKIVNYQENTTVKRGQEKGRFEFGGSTVILLFEPNTITLDADIVANSKEGIETIVKVGEKIGELSKKA